VSWDAIVIGAGHNGLVAAGLLARAGKRVLVLERRSKIGGAASTDEIHPGFRVPTLSHTLGPLRPGLLRDLDLQAHGLTLLESEARLVALQPEGRALVLWGDAARTAEGLKAFSARDAARYGEFQRSLRAVTGLLAETLDKAPPDPNTVGLADVWPALRLGLGFRRLARGDSYGILRWLPMPVMDFAAEWFESEAMRAALCGRGVQAFFGGPRSAGTTANLLMQAALGGGHPAGTCVTARGGPGALADALASAARARGVQIRTDARIARLSIKDERATGLVLEDGEELQARAIVSSLDPKRLLGLIDPPLLHPDDLRGLRHVQQRGVTAKLNLALDGLPAFKSVPGADAELLRGRLQIAPQVDAIERAFDAAKYGDFSRPPLIEFTLPSLLDPSLAPEGRHVLSAYVQYAPYKLARGDWDARRDELGDAVLQVLEEQAPGLSARVLARQVLTPLDLEREYGYTGGHPHHAELSLNQLFASRPLLGWARYRTPIAGLYLCGAGTHPGPGLTGACGANAAREVLKDLG